MTDPRVMYSEPAKFVAKLRDIKTDDNLLLLKCEMGAGHFSKSGRYDFLTSFMTAIFSISYFCPRFMTGFSYQWDLHSLFGPFV